MPLKPSTIERRAKQMASEEAWKRERTITQRLLAEKNARLAGLRKAKEAADKLAAEAVAAAKAAAPPEPVKPRARKKAVSTAAVID